jgi:glycosyltransferase involved in cell wall biosynthesis
MANSTVRKEAELHLYMHPIEFYGPGNYRIIRPFKALKTAGIDAKLVATIQPGYLDKGNVFVFQRIASIEYLEFFDWVRRKGKAFVFDMDDLLTEIPSNHPDYNFFSQFRPYTTVALREATLVTSSSRFLQAQLLRYNPNVVYIPNYIDRSLWEKEDSSKDSVKREYNIPEDSIVVGWMGGHTHAEDLLMIKKAVENVVKKFNKVFLALVGFDPGFFDIPNEKKIFVPFEKFGSYIKTLNLLDIGLAPLKNSLFSLCKSNLKILEYGMRKIATIASPIMSYEEIQKEGAPIFLASTPEEWENLIVELVENEPLRCERGESLYIFVKKNYILQNHMNVFIDTYDYALKLAKGGG